MAALEIVRYAPRVRHGGFERHGATVVDLDTGEVTEYFSRCFECPCGEAMNDGDPAIYDADGRFLAHAACATVGDVIEAMMR